MGPVRFMLDEEDFKHLVKGGSLRFGFVYRDSPVDVEFALQDIGQDVMRYCVENIHPDKLGKVRKRIIPG